MKKTISLLLTILAISGAQAAIVSWSSEVYDNTGAYESILGTGQFDQTGDLWLAENSGGAALSFDGIDFAAASFSFGTDAAAFYAGTGNLAKYATYGVAGTANTVTVGNGTTGAALTVGNTYRIQLLVGAGQTGFGTPSYGNTISVDGQDQGVYGYYRSGITYGDMRLVTGTFTADSATQAFTMETFKGADSYQGGLLNALLVHEIAVVPEPSAYGMIAGFLALGWVMLRRRA